MTWNDAEIYKLIQLIGDYIEYYIYDTDLTFSEKVKDRLEGKSAEEIKEKTRSLLSGLELSMGTKCFRNEVLHVNNQVVYAQELLYQVVVGLPENRAEDVWSPDVLSRYVNKVQQYHHLFFEAPEIFFRNTQIWGKSVTQCKAKFYALKDLQEQYQDETRHSGEEASSNDSSSIRKNVLRTIFSKVPALRVDTSGTSGGKNYRQHSLWTTAQQSRLLSHLLKITEATMKHSNNADIESLIEGMKSDLNRTAHACLNKLINMQVRFFTNDASAKYAQTLPDLLYDRHSQIHKIFMIKDWTNTSDPSISGINAIKKFVNREISDRYKKGKGRTIEKKRSKRLNIKFEEDPLTTTTPINAMKSTDTNEQSKEQKDTSEVYSDFVKEIAKKYSWKEQSSYRLCQAMYKALPLYAEGQLKSFFSAVAAEQTDLKLTELYFKGREIISLFEQDYGKLEKFGEITLHLLPANNQETEESYQPLSVASTSNTSKAQSIDEAGLEYDEDQDYSQVFANEDDENDSDMIDAESIQDNTLAPVENEDNSEEMVESDNPAQFVTQYEKNQTEYRKQNVSEILHDNTQAVVNEEIEEKCDEIHDNVFSATVEKIRTPMPMSWKNLFDQLDTRIKNLKARRDELVERAEERKKQKWQQENDFWSQALTLDVTQMPTSMNSTATSTA